MEQNKYLYEVKDFGLGNDELMLNETLFHNANGYLGVRSNFEEGYPINMQSIRGEYINGFYDFVEMKQAEKLVGLTEEKQTMLNVADTQGIKLILGGEEFSMFTGEILERSRTLDMEKGVTRRRVVWRSPKGKEVELSISRMVSFDMLPLFTIEYRVKALNFDAELCFESTHIGSVLNYCDPGDPRVAGETFQHILSGNAEYKDDISVITSRTSKSDLSVTSAVKNLLSKPAEQRLKARNSAALHRFSTFIEEGEAVTLTKYTVLCDSVRYEDSRSSALEHMQKAVSVPLKYWYDMQEQYLKKYWESCAVHVKGDDELSNAITYNLYQLIQSVGKDPHSNIAAKGLSGEGYEGHYFWDTEMYIQPFFLLTMPEIAKNLIEYRYTTLDAARENARIMGHQKGALFPWRTIMGKECSGYFPSGSAQYHIDGDIAYSIISYYLLTGNLAFIARCGAEIIFETARLWLDTGNYSGGKFRINSVTGPDEYTCLVNNNYYTNVLAQYNLKWAAKFYHLLEEKNLLAPVEKKIGLTETEIAAFTQAAQSMYLPYDEELDINPQDDSFLFKKVWNLKDTPEEDFPLLLHYHPLSLYRSQVCKQADTVLAHFILEDAQAPSTMKHSFEYYEKVTTHDSSLSTCIFSIMASRLGMPEKAYAYFGESSKLDLFNTHKNTKDGIHTANMGGTYMAIVYGFGGLRIKENGLHLAPALPGRWTEYDFKVHDGDSLIQVVVRRQGCEITLLNGDEKEISVYGKSYTLRDSLHLPLEERGRSE
nr:glycosyl hydrolase family 65 protein [uncultured Caproiciproducens sp.]